MTKWEETILSNIDRLEAELEQHDLNIALMRSESDTDHSMGYGDELEQREMTQDNLAEWKEELSQLKI